MASVRSTAAVVSMIGLAALLPASAFAQYTKTPLADGRFKVGPLGLTPTLELRNAGRDDNVFLDPSDPVADTSVVLRGTLRGTLPVRKRLRLSGQGWLDYSYFRRYSTETSRDPGGSGRAELDLGPLTLIGGGGAFRSRQLVQIDIDERTLHQQRWGYAGAQLTLSKRFSLAGGAEARTLRYDGSAFAGANYQTALLLNRNQASARVEGRYALTPLTTAVATASVREDEYAVASNGQRTSRSYRYLGGFEFGQKALLNGRVLAGLVDLPVSQAGVMPSYRGPALSAEVVLPVRSSGRLIGSLTRDVFPSGSPRLVGDVALRNGYVLSSLQGIAEHGLPFDVLARLTVGFDAVEYLLPPTARATTTRVDHLYSAGGSLLRGFSGNLRAGVAVTYYRRVSTQTGASYDRWTYGLSAELVP